MRITFLCPHLRISGGVKAILTYADRLQRRGHKVTVVAVVGRWRTLWQNIQHRFVNSIGWFDLSARLRCVPAFGGAYSAIVGFLLPDADIIVASAWHTAPFVNGLPARKGKKFYLIQHYEVWDGPEALVDATWKMPLNKIVVSSWLKQVAGDRFGENVMGPLVQGVDIDQFHNDSKTYHQPRRIGMLYHTYEWKGVKDGIRAFKIAREKHPDIRLVMFGARRVSEDLGADYEFHLNPPQDRIREIYSSVDVWLTPSWVEGCHLPPMEAMACRCAVVATDVGGIRDYGVPEETVLVSPPQNPEALAANLTRLLDDEDLLFRLSVAGYNHIRHFTWDRAVRGLESYFQRPDMV